MVDRGNKDFSGYNTNSPDYGSNIGGFGPTGPTNPYYIDPEATEGTEFSRKDWDTIYQLGIKVEELQKTVKILNNEVEDIRFEVETETEDVIRDTEKKVKKLEKDTEEKMEENFEKSLDEVKKVKTDFIAIVAFLGIVTTAISSEIGFLNGSDSTEEAIAITIVLISSLVIFLSLIFMFLEIYRFSQLSSNKSKYIKILFYFLIAGGFSLILFLTVSKSNYFGNSVIPQKDSSTTEEALENNNDVLEQVEEEEGNNREDIKE